jgi:DNA transformation protein
MVALPTLSRGVPFTLSGLQCTRKWISLSNEELFSRFRALLTGLDVQSRKMFGGIGIFSEKTMFSLIYDGVLYFRSTENIAHSYSGDSVQYQHPSRSSKMPYWSTPENVLDDESKLNDWAENAYQLAKSLKRK